MNTKLGLAIFFLGCAATVAIRAPHGRRNAKIPVAHSRKGGRELFVMAFMSVGFFILPVVYASSSILSFADYPFHPAAFWAGTALMTASLWLFYRSHADLGTNWSVTLEIRENHRMVTSGAYRQIRHPMYASIFLYAVAQTLLVPNWIAGPACLVTFTVLFILRVGREEQMMLEKFGDEYRAYAQRTKRLVPHVW